MKWTIHELTKLQNIDNEFNGTLDFAAFTEGTDIVKISPVKINGSFEIYDDLYEFYFDIKCTLTLSCAITLVDVPYELEFSVEEIFSNNINDDFNNIEGITIDLLPIIWSNITLEKPMRIISENATEFIDSEATEKDEDESINQAFAKLKSYKK